MGNQLESETPKFNQKNIMEEVNETEWETVNIKTPHPCEKNNGQTLTRIPLITKFDFATECSSKMRWSNTRKVSKLGLAARSIKKANAVELNGKIALSNNPNSTVCTGGLPFQKSMIATEYSPIKKLEVSSQKEILVSLTKPVVSSKNCGFESSASKVKKWLASTEKHCRKRSSDHFEKDQLMEDFCDHKKVTSTANLKISKTNIEQNEIKISKTNIEQNEIKISKTNIEQNEIKQLNEPSPIISEFNHYVQETTYESEILSEISCKKEQNEIKQKVKTQRKRRKKRITMKITPKKAVKQGNIKKELFVRMKGKKLAVAAKRPLSVGSLGANQPHMYNLRSKDRMNIIYRNCAEQITENKKIEYIKKKEVFNSNDLIVNKDICNKKVSWKDKKSKYENVFDIPKINLVSDSHSILYSNKIYKDQLNLPETIYEKDYDNDNLNETPASCMKSSIKSTNNSKRKLSFYDRAVISSVETIKDSEVHFIECGKDSIQNAITTNKLDIDFQDIVYVDVNESQSDVSSCCLFENEFSLGKNVLIKFKDVQLVNNTSHETSDSEISTCFLASSENDF
ncbi:uncharacterized protein LOC100203999 isoform X1 [Hydra vulgaris]|uniref:uncharacterized protein LOC100203999 isoform X1 n=2 Tax=Hydra vulgaris TaxID=6087 RepID=UPI001F5FE580|nr:uncharacterized protein LOC100203999 isoform X1 [Hydra vulgaris]